MSTCIACLNDKELTEEHIVPKSIGGGFAPRILCKECNSKFGTVIDGKFLEQIIIRLACACEGIIGRANRARGAFEGIEGMFEGTDIRIVGGRDLNIKILSDFDVELGNKNEIKIHGTFDPAVSPDYVKMFILQNLPVKLKGKYPELLEGEIQRITESFKNQCPNIVGKKSSHDRINYSVTIDLAAMLLEFEKIAYELACFTYGEKYYLESEIATGLRNDLNSGNLVCKEQCVLFPMVPFISKLFEYLASKKYHAVVLSGGFAHIQLFSITCSVKYIEEELYKPNIFDSRIYIFSYKGDVKNESFLDWITNEIQNDSKLLNLWQDFNGHIPQISR